jgi:hypothetical protein
MSRVLRLASVAIVVAAAGMTAAQSPTTLTPGPSESPTTTTPPPAQSPATPIPGSSESPATTTPDSGLPGASRTIPTGRSTWKSQDGSTLDVTIDPATGSLTGTFSPGFPCGLATALTPTASPLVGTVNGNALAWTLSLSACPSVGTWIGHYQTVDAQEQLATLFTLAVPESPPGVGSTLTGSAVFVRQTTPS